MAPGHRYGQQQQQMHAQHMHPQAHHGGAPFAGNRYGHGQGSRSGHGVHHMQQQQQQGPQQQQPPQQQSIQSPTPQLSNREPSPAPQSSGEGIVNVYSYNLEAELEHIRDAIDSYPFVAMDTEFPGVVARPIGSFASSSDFHYQTLRCNVDLLRIIQLGITLCDAQGNLAEPVSTWQFNFKFSLQDDMYAPESIDLLTTSGINFKKHDEAGIDVEAFGELLISSGLVLLDDVKWISFHSGYDFGYLLKLVSCAPLPPTETEFFELLKIWFPCIYDIKFLMRSCKSLKGGLQDVADELAVARIGPQHQAGSDSLLTASTFFKMRTRFFDDEIDPKYLGNLYGLGTSSAAFHQTHGSGTANTTSTPHMQSVGMPTPGGMSSIASGPPIPPVASAALPIRDPFASPFRPSNAVSITTPGAAPSELPHAASPSPGASGRGLM